MIGPSKIKGWFEKRGVAIKTVETLRVSGSPVIVGFQITTKTGKSGKVEPSARAHDLENLRRTFVKA